MARQNLKVTIQAANRASPHNHFHVFGDNRDGQFSYWNSTITLKKAEALAITIPNAEIYDRKGNVIDVPGLSAVNDAAGSLTCRAS